MVNPIFLYSLKMRYLYLLVLVLMFSCGQEKSKLPPIQGDEAAVIYANEFLKAIGGRDKWSKLEIAYTKFLKSEEQFQNYYSHEWISMNTKDLMLDQEIQGMRNVRLLAQDTGFTINEGALATMNDNLYYFLGYYIEQDYYRNVAKLARGEGLNVAWTNRNQLLVTDSETGTFLFGFTFDDVWLPYQYIRPKFNDQDISLKITEWGEFHDLMIPIAGKTAEDTYLFQVEDFEPCYDKVNSCFDVSFDYEYISSLEDK